MPKADEMMIDTGARTTLYICSSPGSLLETAQLREFLGYLDRRQIELICSQNNEDEDVERLMRGCCALVVLTPLDGAGLENVERHLRIASKLSLPAVSVRTSDSQIPDLSTPPKLETLIYNVQAESFTGDSQCQFEAFLDAAALRRPASQPFAFLAVRIHDDFALVRAAIGCAVEKMLGIPCVWFDDPRIASRRWGVRQRTLTLIRRCALFLADLTYGPNNPEHDSPNTAHEIGMALAYDRPVILSCQTPRRDLYFSAGDLPTVFWQDEQHLHDQMVAWFESRHSGYGRRMLNLELRRNPQGVSGLFPRHRFEMDWKRRYVAPKRRVNHHGCCGLVSEIQEYLEDMRNCPGHWRAVWHPLGFIDIELFADLFDSLRVHIWSKLHGAYRSSGLTIHKHDWSMWSHVICGQVENRTFEVLSDGLPTHRVYRIEYNGTANRLQATGEKVRCAVRDSALFKKGTTYTLAPGVFHEVATSADETTATLVRGIRHTGFHNEILGNLGAADSYETERVPCDESSLRKAVELVLSSYRNS
ncbi:MAG: nucleoside 2-deoxyribosyltransferase [Verrucomicrobiales bacterium]|nr:nucleoside 2-deoxyribosyltransferase [Verrucomicrobiales bacterium]